MSGLVHGFYTNAELPSAPAVSERGAAGYRDFFVGAESWSDAEHQRAAGWLRGVVPRVGSAVTDVGTAFRCHRMADTVYAAMATAYPNFACDEYGRAGGLLVHGLWLALDESRPAGDFGGQLGRLHQRCADQLPRLMQLPDAERLSTLLDLVTRLDAEETEDCESLGYDLEAMLSLGAGLEARLGIVWSAGASVHPSRVPWPGYTSTALTGVARRQLLTTTALLPPRLRLALGWCVGAEAIRGSICVVPWEGGVNLQAPDPVCSLMSRWLLRSSAGADSEFVALISDWQISSWNQLRDAVIARSLHHA